METGQSDVESVQCYNILNNKRNLILNARLLFDMRILHSASRSPKVKSKIKCLKALSSLGSSKLSRQTLKGFQMTKYLPHTGKWLHHENTAEIKN